LTNVVTCEFLGRLGNNLFQVAACIGYSKKHNVPWAIPPGYHHRQIYQYFKLPVYRGNIRKLPVYDTATDEGFPFAEIPFYKSPGVKIRGFWQSYKYFDHAREEVLKVWNLKQHPEYKDFTSIHVRRGDYLKYPEAFGPVTIEYIIQAVMIMKDSGRKKFIVFSDDLAWCKEAFQYFKDWDISFQYSDGTNEYHDLSVMSSCSGNIIANSSFSWIAAYANQNPKKVVISPDHTSWFGPANAQKLDTKDLLPSDWVKIKFR
jgi:hypothetical protein